jgi:hypothetical protein
VEYKTDLGHQMILNNTGYVKDWDSTSCYIKLALYTDDTAITAMTCQPALLNGYLETH